MLPVLAPVAHFVQLGYPHPVSVGRRVLCLYVHRYLREVHIRAYACRRCYPRVFEHFAYHPHRQFPCAASVGLQVVADIHKDFVYRIDVYVFRGYEFQVGLIYPGTYFHIFGHSRRRYYIVERECRISLYLVVVVNAFFQLAPAGPPSLRVDLPDFLHHFEEPRPSSDPIGFERG